MHDLQNWNIDESFFLYFWDYVPIKIAVKKTIMEIYVGFSTILSIHCVINQKHYNMHMHKEIHVPVRKMTIVMLCLMFLMCLRIFLAFGIFVILYFRENKSWCVPKSSFFLFIRVHQMCLLTYATSIKNITSWSIHRRIKRILPRLLTVDCRRVLFKMLYDTVHQKLIV